MSMTQIQPAERGTAALALGFLSGFVPSSLFSLLSYKFALCKYETNGTSVVKLQVHAGVRKRLYD
jgi:hypothetical protein